MENNRNTGIGLPTVLLIVFVVLKLTGLIHWSWVWVLAPFWVPFVLILLILFVGLVVSSVAAVSSGPRRK